MGVPFADLSRDHEPIASELRAAFERLLAGGDFVLGRELDLFEAEYARYVGVAHCVGVASGTAALALGLRAMGIGPGDEVVVPAHTFIASALAIAQVGAEPVFCDVDEERGLIDVDSVASVVSERTAAVLPVHLYGQTCAMQAVCALAERKGLAVMEDAAQAHGARWGDRTAGSFGAASAFSFYPSKNLGALGDGGAICTNDSRIADEARRLRNLGQRGKGQHVIKGFNERLDTLQAAFLRVKLPHLDRWNSRRRDAAARYSAQLPKPVGRLQPADDTKDVFHLYPIRVENRDTLAAVLRDAGIGTGIHYSPAVHQQPPFANGGRPGLPVAERWAREELSLPMFPGIKDREIDEVCGAVADWFGA